MLETSTLKSVWSYIRRFARIRPRVDFFWADFLLIVLFAMLGFAGFSRFPNYAAVAAGIGKVDPLWIAPAVAFNVLLFFRKIRDAYLNMKEAFVASIVLHALISVAVFCIIATTTPREIAFSYGALVAQQAVLAAIYLVVQGWITILPDVAKLRNAISDLDRHFTSHLSGCIPSRKQVEEGRKLCDKAADIAKEILADSRLSTEARTAIDLAFARIKNKRDELEAPRAMLAPTAEGK